MKEIVIKIDDEIYEFVTDPNKWLTPKRVNALVGAVLHGKVLPKGHGRLIDIDKAVENEETFRKYFSITTHQLMNVKIINCTAPSVVEEDTEE